MKRRRVETAVLVVVCGSLAGLLIWSKLRLVSDLPRSAYADPKRQTPGDETGANSDQDAPNDEGAQSPESRVEPEGEAPNKSEN